MLLFEACGPYVVLPLSAGRMCPFEATRHHQTMEEGMDWRTSRPLTLLPIIVKCKRL